MKTTTKNKQNQKEKKNKENLTNNKKDSLFLGQFNDEEFEKYEDAFYKYE